LYAVFGDDLFETIAKLTDRLIEHDVSGVSEDSAWLAKKIWLTMTKKNWLTRKKNLLTIRKH